MGSGWHLQPHSAVHWVWVAHTSLGRSHTPEKKSGDGLPHTAGNTSRANTVTGWQMPVNPRTSATHGPAAISRHNLGVELTRGATGCSLGRWRARGRRGARSSLGEGRRAYSPRHTQPSGRDAVEVRPRCGQGAAEVRPRCGRYVAKVQPRCGRGAAEVARIVGSD